MRNGDAYKIRSLSSKGLSDSEICKRFRGRYTLADVRVHTPKKATAAPADPAEPETPTEAVEAPKRKAKSKRIARKKST